jgi:Bifunctional DNA primase/polymerase, N-terminal
MASTTAVTTVPTHSNYSSAASLAAPRRNSDNLTESPTRTETEAEQMLRSAEHVLDRGWYLFGCPYKTKIGFRGSNGSLDALNNEHRAEALHRWTGGDPKKPANPAIRLDMSGLVVVDVDHGFGGLSDAQVIEKAAFLGLPGTYTVRSGSAKAGAHFYYAGKRTVKECSFEFGKDAEYGAGISGDIKYKGHVMAEGALHASGNRYWVINDVPIAPLPSFWATYSRPKKEKLTKESVVSLSPFELDNLKRDGSQLTGEE